DLHQTGGVDGELLGEGAHHASRLSAVPGLAAEAVLTGAAPITATGASEAEDDPVTSGNEPLGAGAEILDDADGLVSDRFRAHAVPVTSGQVEIGVAHASGGDPDQGVI